MLTLYFQILPTAAENAGPNLAECYHENFVHIFPKEWRFSCFVTFDLTVIAPVDALKMFKRVSAFKSGILKFDVALYSAAAILN